MTKNKEVMSIAIRPQLKEEMTQYAKRKGLSQSTYIGNLIEQAVKLNIDDEPVVIGKPAAEEDVTSVVLKIPNAYKSNPEKLKQWLDVQSAGIIKAVSKPAEISAPKQTSA